MSKHRARNPRGWLWKLFHPPVRHFPRSFDGFHDICACGYSNPFDSDLTKHLEENRNPKP